MATTRTVSSVPSTGVIPVEEQPLEFNRLIREDPLPLPQLAHFGANMLW